MYIIISNRGETKYIQGSWPADIIDLYLKLYGDDFVVISTYSNTIKIPVASYQNVDTGEFEYTWKEYNIPNGLNVNVKQELYND